MPVNACQRRTPTSTNLGSYSIALPRRPVFSAANSIREFGFTNPVLISDDREITAGHGRVEGAKVLGLTKVPCVRLSHLSDAQRRAYVIADNQLATKAGWSSEIRATELQALIDLDFNVELTGFSTAEIDLIIGGHEEKAKETGPADDLPAPGPLVTRPGDLWLLGEHRLICGDSRERAVYDALMGSEAADLVFTDPPYNVKIAGNVCGLGSIQHEEFAFASGEMSEAEFIAFLAAFLNETKRVSVDGAILFVCMDWKHLHELTAAARQTGLALKNLCVWVKDNGGMGTFYRSRHELVFVLKSGEGAHTNTFELGQHGRYRTNVWEYAGVNTLKKTGSTNSRCIRPSSRCSSWRMLCSIARGGARSCSTRSPAPAPRSNRRCQRTRLRRPPGGRARFLGTEPARTGKAASRHALHRFYDSLAGVRRVR